MKGFLLESQKEMLKLLKSKTGENIRTEVEEELEIETRSFHTSMKSVRLNSTQNDDSSASRNNKLRKCWILISKQSSRKTFKIFKTSTTWVSLQTCKCWIFWLKV